MTIYHQQFGAYGAVRDHSRRAMATVVCSDHDTSFDEMVHDIDDMGYVQTDPYMSEELVFEQYVTMIGAAMEEMKDYDDDDQPEESGEYDITTCAHMENVTDEHNDITSAWRETDMSINECHGSALCAEDGSQGVASRKRKQDWSNGVMHCVVLCVIHIGSFTAA